MSAEYTAGSVGDKTTITYDHILVLDQQTTLQPVVWRCLNPECAQSKEGRGYFEFERDQPLCPQCTCGPPVVIKRSLVHLLLSDPHGAIIGYFNKRSILACDPKREIVATPRNGEAATSDISQVNCPGCLAAVKRAVKKAGGTPIRFAKRS